MAGISQLADTFSCGALDGFRWSSSTGGSMTLNYTPLGVQMAFPSSSTSSTAGTITSANQYDLTGMNVTLQVLELPSSSTAADTTFGLLASGVANNRIQWITESGNLQAQQFVAGVKTNIGSQINGIRTPFWLRIGEQAGKTYFSVSFDGVNFGYYQANVSNPITLTSVQVRFQGSCFQAETNPGNWRIRLFNAGGAVLPWGL